MSTEKSPLGRFIGDYGNVELPENKKRRTKRPRNSTASGEKRERKAKQFAREPGAAGGPSHIHARTRQSQI